MNEKYNNGKIIDSTKIPVEDYEKAAEETVNAYDKYIESKRKSAAEAKEIEKYQIQASEYQKRIQEIQDKINEYEKDEDIIKDEDLYSIAIKNIEDIEKRKTNSKNVMQKYEKLEEHEAKKLENIIEKQKKLQKYPRTFAAHATEIRESKDESENAIKQLDEVRQKQLDSIKEASEKISEIKKEFKEKTNIDFSSYKNELAEAEKRMATIDKEELEKELNSIKQDLKDIEIVLNNKNKSEDKNNTDKSNKKDLSLMLKNNKNELTIVPEKQDDTHAKARGFALPLMLGIIMTILGLLIIFWGAILSKY